MTKQIAIKQTGIVEDVLPDSKFRVRVENGMVVLVSLSGKIRRNYIKIVEGDRVNIEVSAYDLYRGRIVHRLSRVDLNS